MKAMELKKDVYWVGVNDPNLKIFDIIMQTKRGTTYNSYLINDEKIALFDTVKHQFFDEYIKNIKSIIGERKIDYIIVQHTELDHSGSLKKLLECYPEATIVGSKAAIRNLQNILNRDFKNIPAVGTLDLGKRQLEFISAPNLHWPDTIFTYDAQDKILFSCDFMGCHYSPKDCITSRCDNDYETEMKYYFDVIMGPFKKFVRAGLEKIKPLEKDIDVIAPSHGPVHMDKDVDRFIKLYEKWSEGEATEKNIQVFYVSAYGCTEAMAKFITKYINNKGIKAECHEITSESPEVLANKIENANGILIGSSTINQDSVPPVWNLLSLISPITNRGKAATSFGSYGWSGEAVKMINSRLKDLKLSTLEDGFKFNFVPSEEDYKHCEEFLEKYLELVK